MRSLDILFETDRFNISQSRDYFINPCCFGDDVAEWLRAKLSERAIEVTKPEQEDWGWYMEALDSRGAYFVGVGGNPVSDDAAGNNGEWRVIIEKHRSLRDRLTGRGKLSDDEPIVAAIEQILHAEPDFSNIHRETEPA